MSKDNMNQENPQLTDENVGQILEVMRENLQSNENLSNIVNFPSNNGVEVHTPEVGYYTEANININPESGERMMLGATGGETVGARITGTMTDISNGNSDDTKTLSETLDNMSNLVDEIQFDENFEIKPEDLKAVINSEGSILNDQDKYPISDKTALELIDCINIYREKGEIRFKDLPEQVQEYISRYVSEVGGYGPANQGQQAKAVRNMLAEMLISEYAANLSMNKYMEEFNGQMESAFDSINEEVSSYIKDYDTNKKEYIAKVYTNIKDEDKKKKMEDVMDAIHDGYALSRMKSRVYKIKRIELEKYQRVFSDFLRKYEGNKYHMYDLTMVSQILNRHLKNAGHPECGVIFLLALCKFCQNYKPENPEQHAFMYYCIYNIVLLDIYKGEQYDEFAPQLLSNIMEIANNCH